MARSRPGALGLRGRRPRHLRAGPAAAAGAVGVLGMLLGGLRAALGRGDGRFQSLYLASPAGMVETDLEQRVLHCNAAFAAIVGVAEPEVVDRFVCDFLQPGGQRLLVRGDGSTRPVVLDCALIRDRSGRPATLVWAVTDIGAQAPAQGEALVHALGELADVHAELALRQSFTDALLETIDVGIVSCDARGVFVVSNAAERAMFGLQAGIQGLVPEQITSLIDVFDTDGRRLSAEEYPLMRALRGEKVSSVDVLVGPVGGPHREVVVRGSQITDAGGELLGAVAALTDVTAERTASRSLDDEHRKLTEAQRLGQLGSFELDFATGTWTFSDQICALWGVEPGAMVPRTNEALIFQEDRVVAMEAWQTAVRVGGHHSYEYRIRRASDGAERLLRSSVEVELAPDGRPLHGRGTQLDITDLAVAEKAAQRANAFLHAVLAASPDYTFVIDLASGAVIYGSRDRDVLGVATEELEGLGPELITTLIHPDDQHLLHAGNTEAGALADGQVLQLLYRGRHADGGWRWLNRRVTPFRRDGAGRVLEVLGVVRDVTDVVQAEDRLTHAALHDNLTGLPNRALLVDRLDAALTRSGRDGREVAVLFCDLDGFKSVNDTGGHATGDAVLLEIARRLTAVLRDGDTVARVGGDEFVIVVEPWNRVDHGEQSSPYGPGAERDRALAVRVAERVAEVLRQPIAVNAVDHVVTASIGITYAMLAPTGQARTVTADDVLQDADAAMYRAKGRGKDRFEVFHDGLRSDPAESGRTEASSVSG